MARSPQRQGGGRGDVILDPERQTIRQIQEISADPVRFAEQVLHLKTWEKSREILRALAISKLIAVKGCHASSKTHTVAAAIPWWLQRWTTDSSVILTGPTFFQAKEGVWREMRLALEKSSLLYPPPQESHWDVKEGKRFAVIRATSKGERGVRMHGIRTQNQLIICDEAPGIAAEIYEAIEGLRAGGNVVVVLLGNPTVPGGYFFDAFTAQRHRWHTITVDGMETPNLKGLSLDELRQMPADAGGPLDDNVMPFLITRRYVREKLDDWGEGNALWESRVRGQFPQQAEGALIPLAWLEAAKWREVRRTQKRLEVGIDVSEAGEDETVAYVHDHGHVLDMIVTTSTKLPGMTPEEIADSIVGHVIAGLEPWKREIGVVRYDRLGPGAYFGTTLRQHGYEAVGVNVGEASPDPKLYRRLKDSLYWQLREAFRRGEVAGLTDELTIAQLASLRYHHLPNGAIEVESKKEIRKRGGKSPDRAEALMLAISATPAAGAYRVPESGAGVKTRMRMTP